MYIKAYMLFWVCLLLHVLFVGHWGAGLRFIVRDSDDAVRQTKSNILRKKSVVVASLCPRFALMNEID